MEKLEITVKIELKDVLKYNYWINFVRYRKFLMWCLIIIMVSNVITAFSIGFDLILFFIWFIFPLPIFFIFVCLIIRINARNNYLSSAMHGNTITCTFDDLGIHTKTSLSEGLIQWPAFYSITETKEYFYLSTQKASAIVLPKRAFNNISEIDFLKRIMLEQVDHKKINFK